MDLAWTDMQDVWRRFNFAVKHSRTLDAEASAWALANRSKIEGRFNPRSSRYEYRLTGDLPPKRLGLILGDALHGYRSTLDNLVQQLLKRPGAIANGRAAFRICDSFTGDQARRHNKDSAGMRPADREIIESFQPRVWGVNASRHPFLILDTFSNADKHRLLLPTVATHRVLIENRLGLQRPYTSPRLWEDGASLNAPIPEVKGGQAVAFGSARDPEDPTLIYYVSLINPSTAPAVELSPALDLHVAWREGELHLTVDHLFDISYMIKELIQAVEKVIDQPLGVAFIGGQSG